MLTLVAIYLVILAAISATIATDALQMAWQDRNGDQDAPEFSDWMNSVVIVGFSAISLCCLVTAIWCIA